MRRKILLVVVVFLLVAMGIAGVLIVRKSTTNESGTDRVDDIALRVDAINQRIQLAKESGRVDEIRNSSIYAATDYASMGEYDEAIKFVEEAIATAPAEKEAVITLNFKLADYYAKAGNYARSVEVMQLIQSSVTDLNNPVTSEYYTKALEAYSSGKVYSPVNSVACEGGQC